MTEPRQDVDGAVERASKAAVLLVERGLSNGPLDDLLTVLHAYKDQQAALSETRAVLEEVVMVAASVLGMLDHLRDMECMDLTEEDDRNMMSWMTKAHAVLARATAVLEKKDGADN